MSAASKICTWGAATGCFTTYGRGRSIVHRVLHHRDSKINGANPYYYLKYLLEEMPKHMEEKGRSFLEDMVPWCDSYRKYEEAQIRLISARSVGGDQEKPLTPKRVKRRVSWSAIKWRLWQSLQKMMTFFVDSECGDTICQKWSARSSLTGKSRH